MASVAVVAAAVRSPALGVILLCLQLRFTLRRMRRTLVLPAFSAASSRVRMACLPFLVGHALHFVLEGFHFPFLSPVFHDGKLANHALSLFLLERLRPGARARGAMTHGRASRGLSRWRGGPVMRIPSVVVRVPPDVRIPLIVRISPVVRVSRDGSAVQTTPRVAVAGRAVY